MKQVKEPSFEKQKEAFEQISKKHIRRCESRTVIQKEIERNYSKSTSSKELLVEITNSGAVVTIIFQTVQKN